MTSSKQHGKEDRSNVQFACRAGENPANIGFERPLAFIVQNLCKVTQVDSSFFGYCLIIYYICQQ